MPEKMTAERWLKQMIERGELRHKACSGCPMLGKTVCYAKAYEPCTVIAEAARACGVEV